MNHIFFVRRNATGHCQAVHEHATGRCKQAAGAHAALAGALLVLLLGGGAHLSAFADGGTGGDARGPSDTTAAGGAGGTRASAAQNGQDGSVFGGGGGGGGGAVDRTGAAAQLPGGRPGRGANGSVPAGAGSGGRSGVSGAVLGGTLATSVTGGAGGNGFRGLSADAGFLYGSGGGGGGEGGVGVLVPAGGSGRVGAGVQVRGGAGGTGGDGGDVLGRMGDLIFVPADQALNHVGSGGSGGDGGMGAYVGAGAVLVNEGSIVGGQGGPGGVPGVLLGGVMEKPTTAIALEKPASTGTGGLGGVGIEGESSTIYNSGYVRGGLDSTGRIEADAVYFHSGVNLLELRAGSTIDGLIHVGSGASARILAAADGQKIFKGLRVEGPATLDSGSDGAGNGNGAHVLDITSRVFGPGAVRVQGAGTVLLSYPAEYTGATTVASGTLRAGAAHVFAPDSSHIVLQGGTLETGGFDQTLPNLTNLGVVSLLGNPAASTLGSTLTVRGPYGGGVHGASGRLILGTRLGPSAALADRASDRLVLSGPAAQASGLTLVDIRNVGGLGALTTGNGIEVISAIGGATTTAQTSKDAFRLINEHVDAGPYEYRLYPADAQGQGENWYLRSTIAPGGETPFDPNNPLNPSNPLSPLNPLSPTYSPAWVEALQQAGFGNLGTGAQGLPLSGLGLGPVPAYRLEVGLMSSLPQQFRQSNFAMLGNLHQRVGDGLGLLLDGGRMAWARAVRIQRTVDQAGTVHPRSEGSLSGFQTGTDLFVSPTWRSGLYIGQLDGGMSVRGFARGVPWLPLGRNELRNEYLGGYATWRQGDYYADAVLQFGRHRYATHPQGAFLISGAGTSTLASLEVGRSFDLGRSWRLEPQLQIAHERTRLDDTDIFGAKVRHDAQRAWMARIGLRVSGDMGAEAGHLRPYARLNFYRTSGGRDVASFSTPSYTTPIYSGTGSNTTEIAVGFTHDLSEAASLYGELGGQWASGERFSRAFSWLGSAGLRVKW